MVNFTDIDKILTANGCDVWKLKVIHVDGSFMPQHTIVES